MLHAARCKCTTQKKSPKIAIWAPSHNFVGLYLCNSFVDNRKKLLSSNISCTCRHNMVNFGPLAAEIVSLVWGTPGNFNGFRVLAALLHGTLVVGVSQTAAFNRERRLYSAGRPSRWALAHISRLVKFVWSPYGIGQTIIFSCCSLLWPPCVADADIIFLACGFFLSFSFYSSPNLSRWRLDVYLTSTHGAGCSTFQTCILNSH